VGTPARADVAERLARARERSGFSQEDVAVLVGQPRTIISNWENGTRRPNSRQLSALASIYRMPLGHLLGKQDQDSRPDFERLLFRDAGDRLDAQSKHEIQRFISFLDAYGEFLDLLEEPAGMEASPFSLHEGFGGREDVRRKADEVRTTLGLGRGPVGDLVGLMDLIGITVYLAPLGADLKSTVSGAFLPHDRVGFSALVNAETTPGRRRFTLAHELGHALFHGDRMYVTYFGRREAAERFADAFAGEFLVPTQSLRAVAEAMGVTKVQDPEVVVHLQRTFKVSYAMMLVRLQLAGLASVSVVERLREVHPVHLADRMGYTVEPDEWEQDPERWGLARYPRRFLRLLRQAFGDDVISVSSAAAMTGLAHEDIVEFLTDQPSGPSEADEFDYFRASS
jgi:transcriptional regulator with XRE-family HTH domain